MRNSTVLIDGDLTIYAEWFFYHFYGKDKRITDGVWFSVFAHRHYNSIKEFLPGLMKVASDKELNNIIAEIKERLGISLDILPYCVAVCKIELSVRAFVIIRDHGVSVFESFFDLFGGSLAMFGNTGLAFGEFGADLRMRAFRVVVHGFAQVMQQCA